MVGRKLDSLDDGSNQVSTAARRVLILALRSADWHNLSHQKPNESTALTSTRTSRRPNHHYKPQQLRRAIMFGRTRRGRTQRTTRTTVTTETVPASGHHHGGHHGGHHTTGHHAAGHHAAPAHHHRRRPSLGDKVAGAFMKLRGSLTRRPGLKVRSYLHREMAKG